MPVVVGYNGQSQPARGADTEKPVILGNRHNQDVEKAVHEAPVAQSKPKSHPQVKPGSQTANKGQVWQKQVFAALLACLAGVLLVTQGGVNTNLKRKAVPFDLAAACASFAVGTCFTLLVAVVTMPKLGNTTLRQAPWYAFLGGIVGPCYVGSAVFLVSKLGFAIFQLCAITGTVSASLAVDTIGFLHLPKRPLSYRRMFALCLLIAGVALTTSDLDVSGTPIWQLIVYCVWAVCAGTVFPIQGCFNGVLVKHTLSPFRAVTISCGTGATVLFVASAVALAAQRRSITISFDEWWMWTGGLCGSILVTCNVYGIPILGAAGFTTMFLSTQLVTATIYDTLGAWGFPSTQPSARRIAGVVVAVLAAVLYQFRVSCPGTTKPDVAAPLKADEPPKRASLRVLESVQMVAKRGSVTLIADDEPDEAKPANEEERVLQMKRNSLSLA